MPDETKKTITVTANYDKDTKRKHKYSAEELGISIGIYIDKMVPAIPDTIVINLKR